MSEDVVSAPSTQESEIKREGLFQSSATTDTKAIMVSLRPHVLVTAGLSHGSSIEYIVKISVETTIGICGNVYRGFNAYNS